jgi:adenosylhomocysteinase
MGAIVIVVEVEPLRGLEAAMDGYQVMPMADAAERGDIFITTTGNLNVIGKGHFGALKDGAILANAGHFNDEIEIGALEERSSGRRTIRPFVEEFTLGARKIFLLAEGRLLNHAAAEANPAAVMDMSFSNQVLAIEYLLQHAGELAPNVYPVPHELDQQIARSKLAAMGMRIDTMTDEQATYANSWKSGT